MKFLVALILIACFAVLLVLMYQSKKLLRDVQNRHKTENTVRNRARVLHPKLKNSLSAKK